MLPEVLSALNPANGGVYVDGTFGAGGYSAAILDQADCTVIAIDRDRDASPRALALKDKYGERLVFVQGCFGNIEALLKSAGFEHVDGFVLDLGVSSFQIDEAERGFSFRFNGPLDMRMDAGSGDTAADIVNNTDETDLANIIYRYGEERKSRHIARAIILRRKEQPFETTEDLADLIRSVVPKSRDKIDPATRTFQALRIAVNDELGELERALGASPRILKEGGKLAVVSFHSLEDTIVKKYLRETSGGDPKGSRHMPAAQEAAAPLFTLESKKAIKPSAQEVAENARSRSARMRVGTRTAVAV